MQQQQSNSQPTKMEMRKTRSRTKNTSLEDKEDGSPTIAKQNSIRNGNESD